MTSTDRTATQEEKSGLFDIDGQSVVIAGAAGGLGGPLARMFDARGARLTVVDFDAGRLDTLVGTLSSPALRLVEDITEDTASSRIMEHAIDRFGRVDVVINATGELPIAPSDDVSPADFRKCQEANVTAALMLSQAAAVAMTNNEPDAQSSRGSILHIASVSSLVANLNYVSYATSKAALSQMVRVLAREWAPRGIRVNAIGPALTETRLTEDYLASPGFRKQAIAAIPMGRLGLPDDLLAPVLMLVTPGGAFVTGQTIYVDGGRTLV